MKIDDYIRNSYAIVMIMEIVYRGSSVAVKDVARWHNIPYDYLASLMLHMRKFGFVKSIRGVHGGYILSGRPDMITVSDVINIMESESGKGRSTYCGRGRGALVVPEEEFCDNSDCSKCFTENVWEKIVEYDKGALNLISIVDLVDDYKKIKEQNNVLQ